MTLDEARKVVKSQDVSDPIHTLKAVAMVLRHNGILEQKLIPIAERLEQVAAEIPE